MDSQEPGARPLIRARNLTKRFAGNGGQIEVLRGIDLDLEAAQTVAIVGASGIGKSTLLHILGTLDHPDDGTIWFKGEDLFRLDDAALARFRNRSVGFVFQFHHLLPEFSAIENTMMPMLIGGRKRQAAVDAAEEILVRVGLRDRIHHRVGTLSGGEHQRVALARALVLKPDVLLADEPTGNLDNKTSQKAHELLLELNREMGMTMVVVTHNMELASLMSRRLTIIEGRLGEGG